MLFVFVVLLAANSTYAQTQNDVTLVVSADGVSKDEATKTALRSAIEQAYGTFVSANTTILNDELVKDEIVTVASGNIKEYKEITCEQMPNGKMFVTLQATVSISNLISYAKSKGAEAEFAGATFGMNMKLKELNKQNEKKVLENLLVQIEQLMPHAFEWTLEIDEPKMPSNSVHNASFGFFWEISDIASSGKPNVNTFYVMNKESFMPEGLADLLSNIQDYYEMCMQVGVLPNQQAIKIYDLMLSTLSSLSLSKAECNEYNRLNIEYSTLYLKDISFYYKFYDLVENDLHDAYQLCLKKTEGKPTEEGNPLILYLRISDSEVREFIHRFTQIFNNCVTKFKITDNTGQESYCYPLEITQFIEINPLRRSRDTTWRRDTTWKFPGIIFIENRLLPELANNYWVHGSGLFQYAHVTCHGRISNRISDTIYFLSSYRGGIGFGDGYYYTIRFYMPKADISKYTNFKVEPKE